MALSTIRKIVGAEHVIVLGSAPLTEDDQVVLQTPNTKIICVNGSISSIDRVPDVWLLNSREYDSPIYLNPTTWPPWRQQLHEKMMDQGTGRTARHIAFLLKNDHPDQTIERLKTLGVRWRGQTSIHPGIKTDLTRQAGVSKYTTAFNISAGLFGAALALTFKASHVTLCGFSFSNGYAYAPEVNQNTRFHIDQDKEAIAELSTHHGDKLTIL